MLMYTDGLPHTFPADKSTMDWRWSCYGFLPLKVTVSRHEAALGENYVSSGFRCKVFRWIRYNAIGVSERKRVDNFLEKELNI